MVNLNLDYINSYSFILAHCISLIIFMPVGVRDLERRLNYAAIIVCLDNSRLTFVIVEFTETVLLFSQS